MRKLLFLKGYNRATDNFHIRSEEIKNFLNDSVVEFKNIFRLEF